MLLSNVNDHLLSYKSNTEFIYAQFRAKIDNLEIRHLASTPHLIKDAKEIDFGLRFILHGGFLLNEDHQKLIWQFVEEKEIVLWEDDNGVVLYPPKIFPKKATGTTMLSYYTFYNDWEYERLNKEVKSILKDIQNSHAIFTTDFRKLKRLFLLKQWFDAFNNCFKTDGYRDHYWKGADFSPREVFDWERIRSMFPQITIIDAGQQLPALTGETEGNAETHDGSSTTLPQRETSQDQNIFLNIEDYWIIKYNGEQEIHIEDSLGMLYISKLIKAAHNSVSCTDLAVYSKSQIEMEKPEEKAEDQKPIKKQTNIDQKASDSYRRKLKELIKERQEAVDNPDDPANEYIKEECDKAIKALEKQLREGNFYLLPGNRRKVSVAVRNAINRARKIIAKKSPNLGEHLKKYIHTGVNLSYDPPDEVTWNVSI